MREPRAKQRFPDNGKELYELLRRDYEPLNLWVCIRDELKKNPDRDTMVFDRFMDPMLYFWPVERQYVVVRLHTEPDPKFKKRLVDALLRDGARCVTVLWHGERLNDYAWKDELDGPGGPLSFMLDEPLTLRWENFGDVSGFWADHYDTAVDPLAVPGRGSGPN